MGEDTSGVVVKLIYDTAALGPPVPAVVDLTAASRIAVGHATIVRVV